MTRKTTITVAVSALVVALAIGASVAGAKPGRATAPVSTQAKYTIALSNSFIGNKWRIEMENLFKAACKMPPYKNQVDCSVYNSGNDVSKQTQQISNLISQGVDAIVINAASPTGLNGDHRSGLRTRHPGRLLRQRGHRAVRAQGQHRPAQVRPAAGAVPGRRR